MIPEIMIALSGREQMILPPLIPFKMHQQLILLPGVIVLIFQSNFLDNFSFLKNFCLFIA